MKREKDKMKILQVAPIYIPITPNIKYGGIERVVLALSKSFDEKGHDVVTAAPADSNPYGKLFPTLDQSEWMKPRIEGENPQAYEAHVSKVIDYILKEDIDVVHDHTGNFVLTPLFKEAFDEHKKIRETPFVVTPHELRRFAKMAPLKSDNIIFTSLSRYQKGVFSEYVDVDAVVNNGVEISRFPFNPIAGDYLFSLGSIERDKGQDLAVKVALASGMKLKIGGNIANREYFDFEIKLHGGQVEYVGELNDKEKVDFYRNAKASILPIRIGDCFTLTRIESLACGTPVITLDTGSAREAVDDGDTGYVVPYDGANEQKAIDSMVDAVSNVGLIDRVACREVIENNFTWDRISNKYLDLYRKAGDRIGS